MTVLIQLTEAQVASVIAQNSSNTPVVVEPPHVDPPHTDPQPYVPPTNLPGYAKLMEIPWQTVVQMRSADIGGFALSDTLICHFRTPNVRVEQYGSIGAVEFGAGGSQVRQACLSRTPGDMVNGFKQTSIGPTFNFMVGVQDKTGFAAMLQPETDYYLNLQNDPNTNETAHDVQVTLKAPRGTA